MGQKRILIIDDDPDFTEATQVVLESQGYVVASASDGSEAILRVGLFNPDLIILDVMMDSNREGFVLARELKKYPEYKEKPILMVFSSKGTNRYRFQISRW